MKDLLRRCGRELDVPLRRGFDIVAALAGLVLLLPLLAIIAVAVPLDTRGPVFYSQLRVGRGGKPFRLHKFRKFRDGAPEGDGLTRKNDSRMTRVGRLLERSKLDELPQLWNILVGDMSVVGPRPETLDFADCFSGPHRAVLDHKPGLFGPNQAIFRNESSLYPDDRDPSEFYRRVLFPTKANIDLAYFPRRTFWGDIGWIARAGLAVFGLPGVRAGPSAPDLLLRATPPAPASPDQERILDVI